SCCASCGSSASKAFARRGVLRTLVWFRGKDLRLADHAPLADAARARPGGEIIPLFVLDEHFFRPRAAQRTPARIQFLLESIAALASGLERAGSRLIIVGGRSVDVVPQLARRWKVDRVVAQSWVAPVGRARDRKIAQRLHVPLQLF